jgi:hypothetical protein
MTSQTGRKQDAMELDEHLGLTRRPEVTAR